MTDLQTVLWFEDAAEEAARLYVDALGDGPAGPSRIDVIAKGPDGARVMIVDVTLRGQGVVAMNGRQERGFTEAMSLLVSCADQAEIDRIWSALGDGGSPSQCGWLTDRFGVSWQITHPRVLELLTDPDAERAARVMAAFLGMSKIDLAALEAAHLQAAD